MHWLDYKVLMLLVIMFNELWLNSNGTEPFCFQAHNSYFANTCIPVRANISRGSLRIILKDIVVLTCKLLSFQRQQGSFLRTISLIIRFWTLSERGQAEPFPKFCLLLLLLAPAGIFEVRNMKQMYSRSQNSSVGLVASLRDGRPSLLVQYRRGRSAFLRWERPCGITNFVSGGKSGTFSLVVKRSGHDRHHSPSSNADVTWSSAWSRTTSLA